MLIKPFSVHQYVKGLKRLMDSPDLLNQMATNARRDIKKYSVEKVVDQWESLLENVLIMNNTRYLHIDIAKGLGILAVIGLHTGFHINAWVGWEMPLFSY